MQVSTSALLVLRGNITGEKHSFSEKQCYSLEDYIEASFKFSDTILFDQLNVIDTGRDHNRGKGGKKHEKKSIIGQCLMVGNNRCWPQNNE